MPKIKSRGATIGATKTKEREDPSNIRRTLNRNWDDFPFLFTFSIIKILRSTANGLSFTKSPNKNKNANTFYPKVIQA